MRGIVTVATATVLLLGGFGLGGALADRDDEERWNVATVVTWAQYGPAEKTAYVNGFLAGSGLADAERAAGAAARDTLALGAALDSLVRWGHLRFPFGTPVYASQVDDYYWWETHAAQRLPFVLREVDRLLKRER